MNNFLGYCLAFLSLMTLCLSVSAIEPDRGWHTSQINNATQWDGAIHAQAGVDCHGCHSETDSETANTQHKTVTWNHNSPITIALLTREEYDQRCQKCHSNATHSYQQSFHGKHQLLGKQNVPTCSYCHAGHERPLLDPSNPLHSTQIGQVCAGCHSADSAEIKTLIVNASDTMSTIKMHQQPDNVKLLALPFSSWINGFYTLLLFGVLAFFGFYFIIDLPKTIRPDKRIHLQPHVKMSKVLLGLHLVFSAAFVILAVTGFAIKYPDTLFSHVIMALIGEADKRSIIHRIAAIAFVGSAYLFFAYAIVNKFNIKAMVPQLSDLRDLKQSLRYRMGIEDKDAMYKTPITWIGKFNFWASVIGIHIVLVTGITMWFMEWTLAHLSYAIFKYAQLIHGWEAILATCTIIFVHGYLVVIRPIIQRKPRQLK